MKSSREHNWNIPQRQSPAGLIVIIYKAIQTIIKLLWPLLLVFVFREGNKGFDIFQLMLIGVPSLILARSIIDFYFFRFYILNNDLVIKRGFFLRRMISIPLDKIQSVHIEQNLVHRLLNVAKLTIDTAGSEKSEAEIDAIAVQIAEDFKLFLLKNEVPEKVNGSFANTNVEFPIITLGPVDLLKLGLSANHLRAFLIVLAFSISVVQDLSEIFGNRVIEIMQESSSAIGFSLASLIAIIVFVLSISVLVSLIRTILIYANFECHETEKGLRIRTGLVNSKQKLVPAAKIQFMSWEANWIRRKIGIFMLEIHQAQNQEAKKKQRIRIPITQPAFVNKLLEYYHPLVKPVAHSEHRIDKVYPFRRVLVEGFPLAIVGTLLTYFWLQGYAFLFLLWIPYVLLENIVFQRKFRLYLSPEAFQINSGAWGRESRVAQWYKIQYMQLTQSIYQRRHHLATVIIHTAGGQIKIPYIDLALAQAITNYALYKVEATDSSWN